jgi:quercetin dioxygenase-like cupin family protein
MKLAVISGDPTKAGPYTVRLQFPAGYRFPVHWHPTPENLTVVSGTFQLAMGNTANWSELKSYSPGDYIYMPPRHAHFGGSTASGASVIQLHGQGPFQVMVGPPM